MPPDTDPSFLLLFQREYGRVVRLVQRIVGCPSIAEDLAQEAFIRIMHRSELGASYLFRTAQNLAFDHLRAQKVRARYTEETQQEQGEPSQPSLDESMASSETLQRHLEALKSLPERTQRVFLLSRLDGKNYREIAQQLGVSISTVQKDMIKALQTCIHDPRQQ